MTKRYAVCPGWVISRNDGQRHHITFRKLVRLYGVNPAECVDMSDPSTYEGVDTGKLLVLEPKFSGDYTLEGLRTSRQTVARLKRKIRRVSLAWNVCFNTPDGEKVRAILGTEKEALQVGRLSAPCLKASSWKTVPFPQFSHKYRGKLEPAMCPDWTLVRPPHFLPST